MRVPDDPTPPIARRTMVVVRVVSIVAALACLGLAAAILLGIGLPHDSLLDASWLPWSDEPLPPLPGVSGPYPIPPDSYRFGLAWDRSLEWRVRGVVYGSVVLLGLAALVMERRRHSRTDPLILLAATLTVATAYVSSRLVYDHAVGIAISTPPYSPVRYAPAGLRLSVAAYALAILLAAVGIVRSLRTPRLHGASLGSCTIGAAAWSLVLIVSCLFARDEVLKAGGRSVASLPSAVNSRPATDGAEAGLRITVESDLSVTLEVHPMLDPEDPARSRTLWEGRIDDESMGAALAADLDDPLAFWTVDSLDDAGTTLAIDADVTLGDLAPLLQSLVDAGYDWFRPEAAPPSVGGIRQFMPRLYLVRGSTARNEPADHVRIHLWPPPSLRTAAPATTLARRFPDFGAAYDTLDVGDDGEFRIDLLTEPGVPWRSIVHARDRAQAVLTLVL